MEVNMMAAPNKEYVSLTVTRATRQRAKYISAATGKSLNEITADAMQLLQDKLDLPDPPTPKME